MIQPTVGFIVYGVHKDGLKDPMGTPFIDQEIVKRAKQALIRSGLKLVEHSVVVATVLKRLARRNVYAITSFIFGLDNDQAGVAERTLSEIRKWPPGLPVFGQITPFPATPLYDRLLKEGRLIRPKHWLDFAPFHMAHTPKKMSIPEVEAEVRQAWHDSYDPKRTKEALGSIENDPFPYKISHLIARLFFRGIYFPHRNTWGWLKLIAQHWSIILQLMSELMTTGVKVKGSRGEGLGFEVVPIQNSPERD